ncbi:uncharacterized protein LOC133516501 [Cydia pomonella]|uniref:uncharacterized protein LOC133516501 n=1 Tax=Cydia pomonella TaxID=82600 RepID=UPI002ADDC537|nr:uncharacterized protein LOC133516501 [Cydia pomonella]
MFLIRTAVTLLLLTPLCFGQNKHRPTRSHTTMSRTFFRRTTTGETTIALGLIYYNKASVPQWQREYFKRPINEAALLPPLEKIRNCDLCPRIHIPVCATNKRTYTNICWMNCWGSLTLQTLLVATFLVTESELQKTKLTTKASVLKQKYKKENIQTWVSSFLTQVSDEALPILGEQISNCSWCPTVYLPVCASNGNSFTNKCYMVCNKYEYNGGKTVTVNYMGACHDYGVTWDMA